MRATKDVDIVPSPDPENLARLAPAAISADLDGLTVMAVSYEDLVALKLDAMALDAGEGER